MKTKNEIRQEIDAIAKETLPKDDYGIITSINICKKIFSLDEYKNAEIILAYMALPDEVNLTRLIVDSFIAEKKVYIPKIDANGNMTFHLITAETKLENGKFGILEPPAKDENFSSLVENLPSEKILALIPGRAFTKDGKRLGRGGGYYDKFLQMYGNKITKYGVCFPFQILDELPTEQTDKQVDKIIEL